MKTIILAFSLFFTIGLFGQIDSILKTGKINNDYEKNKKYITFLNSIFYKQNKEIDIDFIFNRNIYKNIFATQFKITEIKYSDSTRESAINYHYTINLLTSNDSVIVYRYNKRNKPLILVYYSQRQLMEICSMFQSIYNAKLDTSKLFIDDSKYITNIGEGGGELSLEMVKVISSIKMKKYKNLLFYLKSSLPEDRLYGLLGVEILKQKKVKIPIDVAKYYEISKNTKGKAYNCEGDVCMLDDFQNILSRQPQLAKQIIILHNIKK